MEMLSERYGWTPDQIRNLRLDDLQYYIEIIRIKKQREKRHANRKK